MAEKRLATTPRWKRFFDVSTAVRKIEITNNRAINCGKVLYSQYQTYAAGIRIQDLNGTGNVEDSITISGNTVRGCGAEGIRWEDISNVTCEKPNVSYCGGIVTAVGIYWVGSDAPPVADCSV